MRIEGEEKKEKSIAPAALSVQLRTRNLISYPISFRLRTRRKKGNAGRGRGKERKRKGMMPVMGVAFARLSSNCRSYTFLSIYKKE